MNFTKRLLFYVVIILLIVSLYKDITIGTPFINDSKLDQIQQIYPKDFQHNLSVAQVRVQHGDTVLSITERVNHQLPELDIEKIITDFKAINPNIDPYHLQTDTFYYFPVYD